MGCTKVSHQMYVDRAVHGAFISYCKYRRSAHFDENQRENRRNFVNLPSIFSYNSIKSWIQKGNSTTPLGPAMHMVAAAEAGILTLMMTNPIWVVKTRLCLQYGRDNETPQTRYKGMIDALARIYREEGIRGLYRVCILF